MARAHFQRLDPDFRRQSLIDATAHCLARYGIGGTSVRTICAEAGVSAGLLRHYFAGIDELIAETYADVGDGLVASMIAAADEAGPDPREQLRAFVMASFKPPIADPDKLATWLAFWSLIKSDSRIRELHTENYASHRMPVERMVREILGPEASQVDVRLTAVGVTALVDGLWLEICLDSSTFTPEEASRIADKWLNTLVGDPLKVLAD